MATTDGAHLGLPWRLRRVQDKYVAGNRVRLLRDGREAFPAMLAAIAAARQQILLEMYWFDSNRIGRRFAAALADALARGVEVAIIYDSVGSIGVDTTMFDELAEKGAHVLEFNPLAPWKRRFRLARLTRRDHRKILVVDGDVGFTGGINIGDQWLPEEEEGGNWRDDMVMIEGPAARGFVQCFHATWRRARGERIGRLKHLPRSIPPPSQLAESAGEHGVRVLGAAPYRNRHTIVRSYLSRIYRAERRIWIANSYFIPDRSVIRALSRAAARGVDVRILLPQVSDVIVADWASRAVWGKLLRRGVKIYQWTYGILHSKTAVIDGRWSTIGTFNLDYISIRNNLEVNATIVDEGFGAALEAQFERDIAGAYQVDANAFRYRSLGDRLLEALAYRLRKML